MNSEQIQQLKTMVAEAGDLPEAAKDKLLELLAQQEAEVETAPQKSPEDVQGQWLSSVGELEAAHPEATGFLNRMASALANMGI